MLGSRLGRCLLVATSLFAASEAKAWTCGAEPPGFVLPPPTVAAPLNVRPVVRLEYSRMQSCPPPLVCSADAATMELWSAPRRGKPREQVAADILSTRSDGVVTFVIQPKAPLEPLRRYEVRGRPDTTFRSTLLGSFRTGNLFDRKAPEWRGTTRVDLHPLLPVATPKRKSGPVVIPFGPRQTTPYVEVFGPVAIDDQAAPGSLSYALWTAKPGEKIDYSAAPAGFFRQDTSIAGTASGAMDRLFVAGAQNECFVRSLELPTSGKITIGVRAVDLAGNQSEASETTLDLNPTGAEARVAMQASRG
ncbi:MAG: hypothetical protein HOV80_14550 [Polyangiaceae bacterium]|nr:hypothetical protein [Polyangiaceae bacterium]